jgi:hypothetical protein
MVRHSKGAEPFCGFGTSGLKDLPFWSLLDNLSKLCDKNLYPPVYCVDESGPHPDAYYLDPHTGTSR